MMRTCQRCDDKFETTDWRRRNCFTCSPRDGIIPERHCKSCGVSIGFDGRKKFCDSCWRVRRAKQQKDWLHRTKVGKAEDCFQPADYCYMDLVEAMIEHCWEPECETCILDGYCMKRTWVSSKCLSTSVV